MSYIASVSVEADVMVSPSQLSTVTQWLSTRNVPFTTMIHDVEAADRLARTPAMLTGNDGNPISLLLFFTSLCNC
jgi:sigma54-dependent transcription regulator